MMDQRQAVHSFERFVRERVEATEKCLHTSTTYLAAANQRQHILKQITGILQQNGAESLLQDLQHCQYEYDHVIYQAIYIQGMNDLQELPIYKKA